MLNRLRLTNYRQHTDREFTFTDGVNVIKGPNEGGKTTLVEAWMYLCLGSGALSEPLADVVTYDVDVKHLRVEGTFTVDGVVYEAYRSPKGAEIVYSDKRVTGQGEVTRFMERLLGAKSDTVRKLMIAEQNAVRGILDSEANAGDLIESLADLGLIDSYIEKIQAQLPSGPTKGAEAALQTLRDAVQAQPEAPDGAEVAELEACMAKHVQAVESAGQALSASAARAREASGLLENARDTETRRSVALARKQHLEGWQAPTAPAYTQADLEVAVRAEADSKFRDTVLKAKATVFRTAPDGNHWTGTEESAKVFVEESTKKVDSLRKTYTDVKVRISTLTSTKINEDVCSFCKMDISQLPAVAEKNLAADVGIAELNKELASVQASAENLNKDIATVKSLLEMHQWNLRIAGNYWTADEGIIPATFTWTGPELPAPGAGCESSAAIRSVLADYAKAEAAYAAAKQELAQIVVPEPVAQDVIDNANHAVSEHAAVQETFYTVKQAHDEASAGLAAAKRVYSAAVDTYEAAVKRREESIKAVGSAEKLLSDMCFNNQLIADLRDARSEVRKRLWAAVTAAISVYFSRVRKIETRITKADRGFAQNGKPVKGLSGSAKDMLGLSIRGALMKTFIPGVPMMAVDEPFAGCDDNREAAGLAVLSQMGFPQTLVITHSDLADSLADNLIQL